MLLKFSTVSINHLSFSIGDEINSVHLVVFLANVQCFFKKLLFIKFEVVRNIGLLVEIGNCGFVLFQ